MFFIRSVSGDVTTFQKRYTLATAAVEFFRVWCSHISSIIVKIFVTFKIKKAI